MKFEIRSKLFEWPTSKSDKFFIDNQLFVFPRHGRRPPRPPPHQEPRPPARGGPGGHVQGDDEEAGAAEERHLRRLQRAGREGGGGAEVPRLQGVRNAGGDIRFRCHCSSDGFSIVLFPYAGLYPTLYLSFFAQTLAKFQSLRHLKFLDSSHNSFLC